MQPSIVPTITSTTMQIQHYFVNKCETIKQETAVLFQNHQFSQSHRARTVWLAELMTNR